jgi:hypothetical protein
MSRNAVAILALGLAVLASCGGDPGYQQAVPGTFVRVGGPAPGSPVPVPGMITARAATGQAFTATAGQNGRFTLSLPPDSYHVTNHGATQVAVDELPEGGQVPGAEEVIGEQAGPGDLQLPATSSGCTSAGLPAPDARRPKTGGSTASARPVPLPVGSAAAMRRATRSVRRQHPALAETLLSEAGRLAERRGWSPRTLSLTQRGLRILAAVHGRARRCAPARSGS